jgi:transcriptional regulator with XRE-family HTH domain
MSNPGSWLRERREELHLTLSGVERLTSESASKALNERYRIRRGRLADLEEGRSAPDIFEVASLCECYKITYPAVLQAFGMKLGELRSMSEGASTSNETSKQWSFTDTDRPFSLTFQSNVSFSATRLVMESPEELGVPAIVRQRLDLSQYRLGIIGVNDDTMGELVPAGSLVVIDNSFNTVEMADWKSIRERPIYFVWHENGYSCSWCNLVHETLFIVPYPTSRQPVMIFKTPRAATIIGRIIHVWAPLITQKRLV